MIKKLLNSKAQITSHGSGIFQHINW